MALHQATWLEDVPNSYDQSLFKEIVVKHHWMGLLVDIMLMHFYYSFFEINSFQHILLNIFGFTYVCIQLQGIKATPLFMSKNPWIQHLARISLPWWPTPCMIHSFSLTIAQIIGNVCKCESTSIQVYKINPKSEINVPHLKSSFWSSKECNL
jgi:hypothetical protein